MAFLDSIINVRKLHICFREDQYNIDHNDCHQSAVNSLRISPTGVGCTMVLPVELTDIDRQLFFTTLLRSSPRWYILLILL